MTSTIDRMERPAALALSASEPADLLETFMGPERILGVLPFVADLSTTPRWHHLLFTEDKVLAVPASAEPEPDAVGLFLPPRAPVAARYPTVRSALAVVAVPRPLTPAHVTAVLPYAAVRGARLSRGRTTTPELELRAGRRSSWWFFRTEDGTADLEKTYYARDLLLALLPFPLELVGFSEVPRPSEWHLRRGAREPLPLLAAFAPDGPGAAFRPPYTEAGPSRPLSGSKP